MLVSICEVGLAGGKRCICHRERLFSAPDLDARYSKQSAQLFGWHQHRSGGSGGSWRGLRESGGHRGMESHTAFHFLHQLMDMAIEHGDRAEPFEQGERLGRILRAPAPFRINRPERNMREDDDRRRARLALEVGRKPSQLFIAKRAHAARFQIGDVDKADKVHAALIEGKPAGALGVLAMTFEIGLAIVLVDNIVLARHVMNIELGFADDSFRIVEFPGLRKMGDVAGVDHEGGLDRKSVYLGDRFLQGPERIRIGRLVETDVAIRNLQEAEAGGRLFGRLRRSNAEELRRFGHAATDRPDDARAGPDHAFERAAPVDSCALLVVRHVWSPWAGALARCYEGDFAARLFIPGALRIFRGHSRLALVRRRRAGHRRESMMLLPGTVSARWRADAANWLGFAPPRWPAFTPLTLKV